MKVCQIILNEASDKDLYNFTCIPCDKLIKFTQTLRNRYIELLGEGITRDQQEYLDSCIGLGLGDGKLALEAMKKKHDEKVKRNHQSCHKEETCKLG